jgi:hypothetical protein
MKSLEYFGNSDEKRKNSKPAMEFDSDFNKMIDIVNKLSEIVDISAMSWASFTRNEVTFNYARAKMDLIKSNFNSRSKTILYRNVLWNTISFQEMRSLADTLQAHLFCFFKLFAVDYSFTGASMILAEGREGFIGTRERQSELIQAGLMEDMIEHTNQFVKELQRNLKQIEEAREAGHDVKTVSDELMKAFTEYRDKAAYVHLQFACVLDVKKLTQSGEYRKAYNTDYRTKKSIENSVMRLMTKYMLYADRAKGKDLGRNKTSLSRTSDFVLFYYESLDFCRKRIRLITRTVFPKSTGARTRREIGYADFDKFSSDDIADLEKSVF